MDKIKIIAVAGPTGTGKSDMAVAIAEKFGGEVVSCDSMQIYRGLDVGTAKITTEQAHGIPHHMINIKDVGEEYSVSDFQSEAKRCIHDISSRGKLPVIAGGTGFYLDALINDVGLGEVEDASDLRIRLKEELAAVGRERFFEKLKVLDPDSAERIHPNNTVRVMRALEINILSGMTVAAFNEKYHNSESPFDALRFVLDFSRREVLYGRLDRRVDAMVANGLLNEARSLYEKKLPASSTALQAIGYKEFFSYFSGEVSFEESVAELKKNTRHYAKRQLTWFRREIGAETVRLVMDSAADFPKILDEAFFRVENFLKM